jgi:cobalt/nickel transport system permease protein
MAGVHAIIGIGEALITVGALAFIRQTRPDLLAADSAATPSKGTGWIAVGLVIALIVVLISPLANPNPDGLERVAEDKGFINVAEDPSYEILPDYTVPFIENEALTTILAGLIGVVIVAGIGYGMAQVNRRKDVVQQVSDSG